MNVAEQILVAFLSTALLLFLILAIVLVAKLIGVAKEVKQIVIAGQKIADDAGDVVENVKDMTSIGGIVKTLTSEYLKKHRQEEKKGGKK